MDTRTVPPSVASGMCDSACFSSRLLSPRPVGGRATPTAPGPVTVTSSQSQPPPVSGTDGTACLCLDFELEPNERGFFLHHYLPALEHARHNHMAVEDTGR